MQIDNAYEQMLTAMEQCDTFRDVEKDLVQMHQRRAEVYERKLHLR